MVKPAHRQFFEFMRRHFVLGPKHYVLYFVMALYSIGIFEAHAVWRAEMRTPNIQKILRSKQTLGYDDLTSEQIEILLKVEDPNFFGHRGIDFTTPGQGISTLTQSLTRRIYFNAYREGFAKLEQTFVALNVVDWHFTKRDQITAFLNVAYFGSENGKSVTGFENAAQIYFGKSFFALTPEEYIGLVGMLAAPNILGPSEYPLAYSDRVDRIKKYLKGNCKPENLLDTFFRSCGRPDVENIYEF